MNASICPLSRLGLGRPSIAGEAQGRTWQSDITYPAFSREHGRSDYPTTLASICSILSGDCSTVK